MPVVKAINLAPVKSLGLFSADSVHVGVRGIEEDRRFLVRNRAGVVVTQRQIGRLAQVKAEYSVDSDVLRLVFPDGSFVSGHPERGRKVDTKVFRRTVEGRVVVGDWSRALSEFCRAELTLVKADESGACFDEYPISALSQASVERLIGLAPDGEVPEYRRFRPNLLVDGCEAHEEDSWLGSSVGIGGRLRLRMVALDPRCAITTLNPDTGERDLDTLRLIVSSRSNLEGRAAYFGVYGVVESPGVVAVGDEIEVAD